MGSYPLENTSSTGTTGTMTRIVEKASNAVLIGAMEQTKLSKKIFYRYVYFYQCLFHAHYLQCKQYWLEL